MDQQAKKTTTTHQFEALAAEMEKNPNLARGIPIFGDNKATMNQSWDTVANKLNALGPPIRTGAEWRKVWTDLKNRTKKKISANAASIRQTGGGAFCGNELSPIEQSVDRLMYTSSAADPKGAVFGLRTPAATYSPPVEECGMVPDQTEDIDFVDVEFLLDEPTPNKRKIPKKSSESSNEMMELVKLQNQTLLKQNEALNKNTEALGALIDMLKSLKASLDQ